MRVFQLAATGAMTLLMTACGGGGGGPGSPPPEPTFTVGGNVTGLQSGQSVVLQLNGGDDTTVASNTGFTFSTAVASGANYSVTVKTPPVGVNCPVSNGSAVMGGSNITNVLVACSIASYNISVTVQGLPYGQTITLKDNGTDTLVTSNGTANFPTAIAYNNAYSVTVPAGLPATCTLSGTTSGMATAPVNVVVDCPHFAYVTNLTDGTLSTYQLNNATGGLTVTSANPFNTIASPYLVTTDPSQSFLFVTSGVPAGAGINSYGIDPTTGLLTANNLNPFVPGTQSTGLAFDPSGTYAIESSFAAGTVTVFATDGSGDLTPVTGATYPVGSSAGTNPGVVAITPNGQFAYVPSGTGATLYGYKINSDGTLTPGLDTVVLPAPNSQGLYGLAGLAINPGGSFIYVGGINSSNVYGFSIGANGNLTAINNGNPFPAGANPSSITIHPNGKFLYVANYGSSTVSGYTITPVSGVLMNMTGSPFNSGAKPQSVALDPTGQFAYVVNSNLNGGAGSVSVFAINQATGVLTEIAGSPFAAGNNPQTMVFK